MNSAMSELFFLELNVCLDVCACWDVTVTVQTLNSDFFHGILSLTDYSDLFLTILALNSDF